MKCPKCGLELSLRAEPMYGKVYVCEGCRVIVIELVIGPTPSSNPDLSFPKDATTISKGMKIQFMELASSMKIFLSERNFSKFPPLEVQEVKGWI